MSNPRRLTIWTLILIVVTAPCAVLFNLFNHPLQAQAIGDTMNTDALLALSIAINRIVEMVKVNLLDRFFGGDVHAQLRAGLALVLALILGVLGAGMFGFNLFAEYGNVPFWVGVVVTGLVIGGGSNLVHAAIELMTQLRDLLGARVERAENQAALLAPENAPQSYTTSTSTSSKSLTFPEAG